MDWRWLAIIAATLFLNFSFCDAYGLSLSGFGTLAVDMTVFVFAAASISAMFFLGPTLAVHASRRSVLHLLEEAIGTVPTVVLRVCCLAFLSIWISRLISLPTLWAIAEVTGKHGSFNRCIVAAAIVAFLFLTGLQSTRTSVRLALFTGKLSLVILLAALIRVRDGWPAVPAGFSLGGQYPRMLLLTVGLSRLALYAAPLGLFVAEYASRLPKRNQAAAAVLSGAALPLFAALTLSSIVGLATARSHFYQPSLNPTVGMALWAHAAGSAVLPRMVIAGITNFGAARFGLRALGAYVPVAGSRVGWFAHVVFGAIIAALALDPYAAAVTTVSNLCGKCLAVAGAVLTTNAVIRFKGTASARRFDFVGTLALLAGLGVSIWLPERYLWAKGKWWLPWLLPTYAVAFSCCLAGRVAQRSLASQWP